MSDAGDFFSDLLKEGRDQWGRPWIIPAGKTEADKVGYTRPSSYADKVVNMDHIQKWQLRGLARAMSAPESQDLRDLAHAELYDTSYAMVGELDENRLSGRNLDGIVERALDRIGWSRQADRGTAIHAFCEDRGRLWDVPEHLKGFVESYWAAVDREGIEILAVETFVACDEVRAAGTFDALIRHPEHGVIVADIKTGRMNPGFAVQKAIYAHGDVYDLATHQRQPLESLSGGEQVNRDVGLIFDVKENVTETYDVDLVRAWRVALAIRVVDDELKPNLLTKRAHRETLLAQIASAKTYDEIKTIWRKTKPQWTDEHKAVAKQRAVQLEEEAQA